MSETLRECPYIETRLSVEKRLVALEKEVSTLEELFQEYRDDIKYIRERIEHICSKNSVQDSDIQSILNRFEDMQTSNRWLVDKGFILLSWIIPPTVAGIISLLVTFIRK